MKTNTSALKAAAMASIAAVLVLLGFTVSRLIGHASSTRSTPAAPASSAVSGLRPDLSDDQIMIDGVTYRRKPHVETYLVLGVDRRDQKERSQSDVLLLLVTDADTDTYRVLQINRDTVTQITVLSPNGTITDEKFEPICLSHAQGTGGADSCENTVRSVEYLLSGAKVDGYISLDLRSIGVLNDAVGGVTVTIDKDLTGADPSFTEGAVITLDAQTAETYVRARMNVDEDENYFRMDRQLGFINAWLEAARRLSRQQQLDLMQRLREICVTNLTEKRMSAIANDLQKYDNLGYLSLEGEYVEAFSYFEFHADRESVLRTVLALFYMPQK